MKKSMLKIIMSLAVVMAMLLGMSGLAEQDQGIPKILILILI